MENLLYPVTNDALAEIVATVSFISIAHRDQKYGNMPYMFHPMEVARTINRASVNEYLAGLLHDVIEDTGFDEAALRERYDDAVVDMVVLLTKDESLDYRGNIQRIIDSGNVGAMKVKLADNLVNYSGDKSHMDPRRAEKLNARYKMSIEMLEIAIANAR